MDTKLLTPVKKFKTLYLDRFRGKPAIPWFDKLFTPYLNSSQYIATYTGSALKTVDFFRLIKVSSPDFGSNAANKIK